MSQEPVFRNQGLAEDTVEVFSLIVPPGFGELPLTAGRAAGVLTAPELERFRRYRVQHRRNDLVLSRILLRVILARLGLGGADPFRIEPDRHGKPRVLAPDGREPFHLNGADTAGMITWALGRRGPVGCDVEALAADDDAVAGTHFAPAEVAAYRALAGEAKRRRFFELWTLKEAVLKADGRGLALPLDSFWFLFEGPAGAPAPAFATAAAGPAPAAGPWRFHSFRPLDSHQAAVAVGTDVPVTFACSLLRLSRYDAALERPWRFALVPGGDPAEPGVEFGVYDPGGGAPPA